MARLGRIPGPVADAPDTSLRSRCARSSSPSKGRGERGILAGSKRIPFAGIFIGTVVVGTSTTPAEAASTGVNFVPVAGEIKMSGEVGVEVARLYVDVKQQATDEAIADVYNQMNGVYDEHPEDRIPPLFERYFGGYIGRKE